ncbi:hypothetical protein R3I94_009402 [Phoxinus phoxinus]
MSNIALVFLSALLIFWAFPPSASERREFHIGPNQTDRKTAEDYCKINYIDLVTVYDEHDNLKLSNLINNNNVSNGWIGTRGGNRSKKWSNGDYVTFNKSLGSCGELCCAAINADGGWESIKCSEKKPFMCYEQVPDVGRNYSFIRENRTWFKAQLYCREKHTDLVSIRDETENERVMEEGEQSNTSFWIGLLEDSVEWADGGKSAYRNWISPNTVTSSPYPEAYMDLNGIWYNNTNRTSYPLCYTSERRLRGFHIGLNKIKRADAEIYCKRKYTGLVTVYDQQDNTKLSNLVRSIKVYNGFNAWIGTRGGNRSKKWSNGDDVTFNRRLGDCGELYCAAMNAEGNWESTQCSGNKPFMCYEQVLDVGRNYSLIRENRTWFEAQRYCREKHTDLVSIRNETENERVMEERKLEPNNVWIGLLEDSVEWVDGGKSAYRNWTSPNTVTSSDYREVIMYFNGNWSKNIGGESFPLCYKSFIHVSESKMSWEDALDYCDTHPKTGLLTIHSHKDQIETEQELNRRNITGPVWVGLRQSRLFGFWIWINGLNVGSYSNWKGGSPPGQISHYCGAMEKVGGQYKWCDKDCRKKYRVLCEMN